MGTGLECKVCGKRFMKEKKSKVCPRCGSKSLLEVKEDVYMRNDFDDREAYIEYLSDMYNTPIEIIEDLSDVLGPNEDFDGLVIALEDLGN
jgi:DNA-directed RNA polymerase subunit RPC12/RpoP